MTPKAQILVVEDEKIIAMDLKARLTDLGYAVPCMTVSGEEAIARAAELRPDLVLMDVILKGEMDGIAAAEQIRVRFSIPVIYLTAHSDEATLQRARITEPYGYLLKPFEDRELGTGIEMALYKHRMEQKLRENEQWLTTMLRSIGDAVIATDADARVKFMNPVAEALTGWRQAEAMGLDVNLVFDIIHETTRAAAENPITKALHEGVTTTLANHTMLITKDGREIPIDDSAAPIRQDDGTIKGVVLVFRDITERRRAEMLLRESEEKYRFLTENIKDVIWMLDTTTLRFLYVSPAVMQLRGYTPEEVLAEPLDAALIPEDARHVKKLIEERVAAFVAGGEVDNAQFRTEEIEQPCKDGSTVWTEVVTMYARNKTTGRIEVHGVTRDISERKRAEAVLRRAHDDLARSNADLERFAYAASHDLREPLRMVASFVQLLAERYRGQLDADADDFIDFAVDGAQRMERLINDLLEYSRVGSRGEPFRAVSANVAVDEALWNLNLAIEEAGATVTQDPLPTVMADPIQLSLLFQNLISNAIKFRGEAPPVVHITARETSEVSDTKSDTKVWQFSVRDNGIGIDPKDHARIFGIFQRLHSHETYPGTGIGLAMCQRIVERHGGRIWVESQLGQGTTCHFTLPAAT